MKIGIVIDSWKLPIFEKHLKAAKHTFVQTAGITKDTLLLSVISDAPSLVEPAVRAAQDECDKLKMH
jgi:hypothetical protein